MKFSLVAATAVVALLGGCATEVISTAASHPVPPARVQRSDLTVPKAGANEIIVKRDPGVYGSGCSHYVVFNGQQVAVLEQGEKVSLFVEDGAHVVGIKLGGGLCGSQQLEAIADVKQGKRVVFRSGAAGDALVFAPTAF